MTDLEKFKEDLKARLVGHYLGVPREFTKPINYVGTVDGVFEVRQTAIGRFVAPVTEVKTLNLGEHLQAGVEFSHGKIPFKLFRTFLAFAREVLKTHRSEVYAEVRWDETNEEYVMLVPHQDSSGGQANVWKPEVRKERGVAELPGIQVMQIHSHPTFSGSFSGKDNHDDRTCWDAMAFGVVGNIEGERLTMEFRINVGGTYVPLLFTDIFTDPYTDLQSSGELTFPAEWLEMVHTPQYQERYHRDRDENMMPISIFKDPETQGLWDFRGPRSDLPMAERIMLVVEQSTNLNMARALVNNLTLELSEAEVGVLTDELAAAGMDMSTMQFLGLRDMGYDPTQSYLSGWA